MPNRVHALHRISEEVFHAESRYKASQTPGPLLVPKNWSKKPRKDWLARAVESCIFMSSDELTYENGVEIVLNSLRTTNLSLLPWEFVFFQLSCSHYEVIDNSTDSAKVIEDTAPSLETCSKCGAKATWEQKQTRSADEGCTVFWKCTNPSCRKTWKRY